MFYVKNGVIIHRGSDQELCMVHEVPRAVLELNALFESMQEAQLDRYTSEGLDRLFTAPEGFIANTALWEQDSLVNWEGIDGLELFRRYPVHAEHYLEGCREYGREPSYEGFRVWLIYFRDAQISGGW